MKKQAAKIRTYECRIENYFEGFDLVSTHIASSSSQARYRFWQHHCDSLAPYEKCLSHIKSKSLGEVKPEHFFEDADMFARICEKRGIPALRLGMVVDVAGKLGYVVGGNCHCNLNVLMGASVCNVHPTWETTYYDGDTIVYDFKSSK